MSFETVRARRSYQAWVANETMEDYSLRYAAKSFRRWSPFVITNTALARVDGATRKAHHINERSADSPRLVTKEEPGHPTKQVKGGHGHPHSHGHSHGPSRPWIIGH